MNSFVCIVDTENITNHIVQHVQASTLYELQRGPL